MPCSVGTNGVTHILSEKEGWISEVLAADFPDLPALLDLGAVYLNKKRVRENAWVALGDYVRLHPSPRRFCLDGVDWRRRIVFENADFWIIDKPGGIPVHATVDNARENLVSALEECTGTRPLVTHRLDTVTGGLVLLAKTPEFQRWFNHALALHLVSKSYAALSDGGPSPGLWIHYMLKGPYAPKQLAMEPGEDRFICETRAERGEPNETRLFPKTGRTHQLRAQMAFQGKPILGDTLYGGAQTAAWGGDRIALHASHLAFQTPKQAFSFEAPPPWRLPSPATAG